ncbi:MAG TPA: hypothetical protein VHJ17_20855 [Thermomonospora sp.]|nr:hypothetical protein [Thermomonospora sp.]
MPDGLVLTRLHRLRRPLCLTRGHAGGDPAVLVIPRGGRLREPRLAVVTALCPWASAGGNAHVVARFDDFADRDRRELADVLVGQATRPSRSPAERTLRVLAHYPGCAVAVGRSPSGCLAALRDGPLVGISGPVAPPWPAVYGSFLHCWTTEGLALDDLARAVVIVGRLPVDGPPALAVAGRARLGPATPAITGRAAS